MSSSVFFRFKSQKEPSRVAFDGTGISVFELKREIITMNRLGDGTDFEIVINSEDTNEEYDDDTSVIPRSTTVIAKRLPAQKHGRGGAARYVSGKMPQNARNSHRMEALSTKPIAPSVANGTDSLNGHQTEEENMAAVLKMGADQWVQQQEQMASAAPVHRSGPMKGKPQNSPDRPPPAGYICYRCGEAGHWIQACPTNNDPAFDGRPRVKRTTGIPRSFLKTVQKPTTIINDGTNDDTKQPSGIMVNADGEWVVAEPDQAAWDQYQAKTKVSAAAQEAASQGSKDLRDRGLECPIDKRLFVEPTKTPCCNTTYCLECITNALIENDLRCPSCKTDDVSLDNLQPDVDMVAQIRSYEEEETSRKLLEKSSRSPDKGQPSSPLKSHSARSQSPDRDPNVNKLSKKRAAESELENDHKPLGPSAATAKSKPTQTSSSPSKTSKRKIAAPVVADHKNAPPDMSTMNSGGLNGLAFPNMNNFTGTGMSMSMPPLVGMNTAAHNPVMMPNVYMNQDWNNIWGTGYLPQNVNMGQSNFQNGMIPYGRGSSYNPHNRMGTGFTGMPGMGMNGTGMSGLGIGAQGSGSFANQQRTSFGAPLKGEEDSAYFRKPVNPHRHQGRRNFNRPTDYREI